MQFVDVSKWLFILIVLEVIFTLGLSKTMVIVSLVPSHDIVLLTYLCMLFSSEKWRIPGEMGPN